MIPITITAPTIQAHIGITPFLSGIFFLSIPLRDHSHAHR
jgi:hypothetical protein